MDITSPKVIKSANLIIGISIVSLLAGFIYAPITHLNFSQPDDRWMLLKYTDVHPEHFSLTYLHRIFTTFNDIQYSPVNTLYYYLIYQINGYDAYYYHLFSVILHLLNTVVVYYIARRIFLLFSINNVNICSFLLSLLWCINPLNVEPVVWISASKVILFSSFSLLSFLNFIKAYQYGKEKYFLYSILFLLLSCFCKEQAIVTPVMFILFVICLNGKKRMQPLKWKSWIGYFSIMLLISIIFGLISLKANSLATSQFIPIIKYPLSQRIVLSFYCISFYLTSQIIPIHLHYHYPFPINPNEWMPISYYIYPIVFLLFCILLISVIRQSKNSLFYIFGIGMFLLQIILVLQIIPMTRPAIMADRYMYIPSFALLMMLVPIGVNNIYFKIRNQKVKHIIKILLVLYVLYFTIYSHHLVRNWTIINLIK